MISLLMSPFCHSSLIVCCCLSSHAICFCFHTCLKNLPSLRHSDHPSPTHSSSSMANMTWHHKYQQYHSSDFILTLIGALWYTLSHSFTFFLPRLCHFVMPPHPPLFFNHQDTKMHHFGHIWTFTSPQHMFQCSKYISYECSVCVKWIGYSISCGFCARSRYVPGFARFFLQDMGKIVVFGHCSASRPT